MRRVRIRSTAVAACLADHEQSNDCATDNSATEHASNLTADGAHVEKRELLRHHTYL